ncbi:hypothetical protein [Bradyrhizobium sp. 199]|uniref:hypothetical protein n=1 Tax=Bradyrhizobium sp. 199 TaxID=2782664 RepID=UPI001FF779B8|nr:hypothetical protein [Bradyrhizobium sp. 199]MCK1357669.1 hypothetical protein [Bradyrhizobium sp. 199]
MLIVRYVVFAGSFALALLFVLDRNLPPLREASPSPEVDRSIIRIHSARALPEKIIFDTSPVAATVSPPLLAAEAPKHAGSDALAMVEPPKPETNITPAPRHDATRAAGLRSNRTSRPASSHRGSLRQVMVGAF